MALGRTALILPGLYFILSACCWQACAKVEMERQVEVSIGETATISCFFNILPAVMEWFMTRKAGHRERIYLIESHRSVAELDTDFTDRISVRHTNRSVILTINNVKLTDEGEFICQLNGTSTGIEEGKTQLKVFVPPEFPITETITVGVHVNQQKPSKIATCETRNGYPEPNITWYRNNTPLRRSDQIMIVPLVILESSGLYTVQSELHLRVAKEDKDATFYCEVSFFVPKATKMIESKPFSIPVSYPTTKIEVWKEYPEGLVKEGDTVKIRCRGDGQPQPILTITHMDEEVRSDEMGLLVLENVNRTNSGIYVCRSLDWEAGEEIEGNTSLEVHYLNSTVLDPTDHEFILGQDVEIFCSASSSLETTIKWCKDGKNVSNENRLYLADITYDMAGEYICEVTVPLLPELQTSTSFPLIIYGPPQMIDPDADAVLETKVGTSVNLTCEAQGMPLPTITWSVTGTRTRYEVVDENLVRSSVNIRVTSDLTASCNATNDRGVDAKSFSIKATPLISTSAVPSSNGTSAKKVQKENGVIIAVIIICILLLAILGSVLYFLYKKGKLACGRSAKKDITKEKGHKDDIVTEMKTDKTEETVLLQGVNGDKQPNDKR
ncbi:cell surface glycoprotein MUC18-like isoform X1 [Scleropages formosus]|uniref:cell surface glycoprotein MUC18-like isoform X1 n=1 Tax=Scleropages formosus TaxID=113540 RepID=UPI0010FAAFDF|nr:cell surface glycoprotein MUC18-like isoform X1 [Scleropages formosus]